VFGLSRQDVLMAFRSPLARRVTAAVFLAIVAIEVAILVPSYLRREAELIDDVAHIGEQLALIEFRAGAPVTADAVAEASRELLASPHIKGVAVFAADGTAVGRAGEAVGPRTDIGPGERWIKRSDDRADAYFGPAQGLATPVALRLSTAHVGPALIDYVVRIGTLVVIISLFVTAVTMVVVWMSVLRPVVALGARMAQGESNWAEIAPPSPPARAGDEIADLYRAFAALLETIRASVRATEDLARLPSENPDPVIRSDARGVVLYANAAAERTPALFADASTIRINPHLAPLIAQAAEGGAVVSQDLAIGARTYAFTLAPIAARGYVNIYATDVTALRRTERALTAKSLDLEQANAALQASTERLESAVAERTAELERANAELENRVADVAAAQERFRAFADSAADFYWEMDANLRFSYFSARFQDIAGVAPDALLGKTRRETGVPGVDEDAWRQHLDDLDNHRPFRNFVHTRRKPTGETIFLSINGVPVFGRAGRIPGLPRNGNRHHAHPRGRERTARRSRPRRTGGAGEVGFPGDHVARDPHADERNHRHDRDSAVDRSAGRPTRIRQHHLEICDQSAGHPERHSRSGEDRVRQLRVGRRAVPRQRRRRIRA
jgi:PAS domain S-box-containing protein